MTVHVAFLRNPLPLSTLSPGPPLARACSSPCAACWPPCWRQASPAGSACSARWPPLQPGRQSSTAARCHACRRRCRPHPPPAGWPGARTYRSFGQAKQAQKGLQGVLEKSYAPGGDPALCPCRLCSSSGPCNRCYTQPCTRDGCRLTPCTGHRVHMEQEPMHGARCWTGR